MFNWDDLKHFLAVARQGSTLAAAKALGVSQSTVHRRLEELEQRLNQRLVVRHPTGYKLTEIGEQLLPYAERVEAEAHAFELRLAASRMELTGVVKVTCPEPVGVRLMRSRAVTQFHDRYPNLRMEFIISDKLVDLGSGQADVAIRAVPSADPALFGRRIADAPWAIYASHAYVERHGSIKRVGDIDRHAIVLFDIGLQQHVSNQWFKEVAPKARIAAHCNSVTALISTVKSGIGLAALPIAAGDKESDLVRLLGPISDLTTHFYLLVHKDMKHSPRVMAFFDFVVENLREFRQLLSGKLG